MPRDAGEVIIGKSPNEEAQKVQQLLGNASLSEVQALFGSAVNWLKEWQFLVGTINDLNCRHNDGSCHQPPNTPAGS